MDVLQNIDVGLVVLDEEFNAIGTAFMQNHECAHPTMC